MSNSPIRYMHTASIDDKVKYGDGLSKALDAHHTKGERYSREDSVMRNIQHTALDGTGSDHELETSLDTRDPMRAVLDVVRFDRYLASSKMSLIPN